MEAAALKRQRAKRLMFWAELAFGFFIYLLLKSVVNAFGFTVITLKRFIVYAPIALYPVLTGTGSLSYIPKINVLLVLHC